MFVHSREEVRRALTLAAAGQNACQISREIGVPGRTISNWLRNGPPGSSPRYPDVPIEGITDGKGSAYAYLLGLYLGDGCVSRMPRTYCLRITLDCAYPGIIDAAAATIDELIPSGRAGKYPRKVSNCCDVVSYSRSWPRLLPQHGPGRKHLRDVSLVAWQTAITSANPAALIRGLIHSDGCRFTANQRVRGRMYSYARYCFVNESTDILRIFCDHLDLLGISWTQQRRDAIQIARREAVARLDEFVGPKK